VEFVDDSSREKLIPSGVTNEMFKCFIKYFDHGIIVEVNKIDDKKAQEVRIVYEFIVEL